MEVDAAQYVVVAERKVQVLAGRRVPESEFRHGLSPLADRCSFNSSGSFFSGRGASPQPVVDEVHEVGQRNGQDQIEQAGGEQGREIPGLGDRIAPDPEDLAGRRSGRGKRRARKPSVAR